jgi:hypothetical protein
MDEITAQHLHMDRLRRGIKGGLYQWCVNSVRYAIRQLERIGSRQLSFVSFAFLDYYCRAQPNLQSRVAVFIRERISLRPCLIIVTQHKF